MKVVGFTGTQRGMTGDQAQSVRALLAHYAGHEFHHGGCVGSDVQAALLARTQGYKTIRHPGNTWSKQDEQFEDDVRLPALPNLERNRVIVDTVEVLIATPGGWKEERRSGTWATVRYARKVGRDLLIVRPDGIIE